MSQDQQKQLAAKKALEFIEFDAVVGVGTGSTVKFFIEELANIKGKIAGAVASSLATEQQLKSFNIPIVDLNSVNTLPVYVDGADEINAHGYMIKGGGAAHTREKIVASVAKQFICLVDNSKLVEVLGKLKPVPVEVIPMARSYVARELVKLGGDPEYRQGTITDNGNVILDVHNLDLLDPISLEQTINNIAGVVDNGIFAKRPADRVIIGDKVQANAH